MKPYQAEAFLGQRPLGLVWIVPRNLRMDTNSQRFVYEPVVCLDERLRSQFLLHHTNIVEREVDRPVYVNNSYYPAPYYVYPFSYAGSHSNRPSTRPPTTAPPPPTFNPGNGTIIKQPIGTPAEKIRTFPSAPRSVDPTPLRPTTLRAASL